MIERLYATDTVPPASPGRGARRTWKGSLGAAPVLAASLALAATGCSQCGPSSGVPPAPTGAPPGNAGTGATTSTAGACTSPAIEDPPACKLARTIAKSPSFAPDGRTLLVSIVRSSPGGTDVESAEVWDGKKGTFVKGLVKDLDPHGYLEAVWSPDGSRLAAAGVFDSHFGFRIFDAATWRPLHEQPDLRYSFPCAIALDPAGERVAMTTLLGVAAIHALKTGKELAELPTSELRAAGHVCSVLEWSGDGKAIQVEGLRDAGTLRPVPYRGARTAPAGGKPVRDEDLVDTRLAPRGDMAAYLDRKGNVRLFSKHGTAPFRVIPAGKDVPAPSDPSTPPVRGVSWKPDATALATWDHTGKVRVWDAVKGDLLRELRAGAKPLEGMADPEVESARIVWAPDGRSFAFWDGERPEVWSLDDGAQKLRNEGTPKPEFATMGRMSWSPDGSLLAAGRELYDTRSGARARTLPVEADQWLDSGRFLLLGMGADGGGSVRVLRVSDGAVIALERLGDDASPVLLPRTEDGVFQGPRELAGCALPPAPEGAGDAGAPDGGAGDGGTGGAVGKRVAPEPRETLLSDFWGGKSIARTCP